MGKLLIFQAKKAPPAPDPLIPQSEIQEIFDQTLKEELGELEGEIADLANEIKELMKLWGKNGDERSK